MQSVSVYQTSLTLPTGATTGARIVLDGTSDTILVYDSLNNLVESIAVTAGTDAAGNHYAAGDTVYDHTGNTFASLQSGILYCGALVNGAPDIANAAQVHYLPVGNGDFQLLSNLRPLTNQNNAMQLLMVPGNSTNLGGPQFTMADFLGTAPVRGNIAGALQYMLTGQTLPGWQNLQASDMAAGYTNISLRYRIDVEDNLIIDGEFTQTTGVTGAGGAAIITARSAPYVCSMQAHIPALWLSSGSVLKGTAMIVVQTSGVWNVQWPATTANGDRFTLSNAPAPRGDLS